MKLLDRFLLWRVRRRHLAHRRRLRAMRVMYVGRVSPDPRCIVRNLREPNR